MSNNSEKKRGGANATKDFLTDLYHKKKKKKRRRHKSFLNLSFLSRVLDPEEADLFYVPFLSSLSLIANPIWPANVAEGTCRHTVIKGKIF
ncbi:hypothetical protein LguiA_014598 [Lonicera macranthoides]